MLHLVQDAALVLVYIVRPPALPDGSTAPQRVESLLRHGPLRLGFEDPATCAQDGMGARDLMGWRPDVHALVVEDEIFDMDEFAGEPKAVAGIGEMGPRDPAVSDRASEQPLIEPGDGIFGGGKRLSLSLPDFSDPIVICCLGLGAKTGEIFR